MTQHKYDFKKCHYLDKVGFFLISERTMDMHPVFKNDVRKPEWAHHLQTWGMYLWNITPEVFQ